MDKLQQILNFTDADGKVITLFDGAITLSQLVMILLCIVAVIVLFKLLKGLFKVAIIAVTVIFFVVQLGIASPTQLKDVANVIEEKGVEAYNSLVSASENIRVTEDNTIEVCIDDAWVNIEDIKSIISGAEDKLTVIIDGVSHVIEDENIQNHY